MPTSACPGCGVVLPVVQGPTHAYVVSSPACWAAYGEVLARTYGDPVRREALQVLVDAYVVQHPGEPGRRSAPVTVLDVSAAPDAARDAAADVEQVRAWGASGWAAWAPHHATVRSWVDPAWEPLSPR